MRRNRPTSQVGNRVDFHKASIVGKGFPVDEVVGIGLSTP